MVSHLKTNISAYATLILLNLIKSGAINFDSLENSKYMNKHWMDSFCLYILLKRIGFVFIIEIKDHISNQFQLDTHHKTGVKMTLNIPTQFR